jgi:pyruvate formate lyase activating enzyme
MVEERHVLDRAICVVCGTCATECYAEALELVGRETTVTEVLDEVLRDKPFYEFSGGGVTLSGGEPLMQISFTEALLEAAKHEGLHACVETCGHADFSHFERILPHVDLYLYDIKDMNNDRHVEFTGLPNGLVLDNLRKLHDLGARICLRLPIIPGYNDRKDHFGALAELVRSMPDLLGVEILPYHRLGTWKAERLGLSQEKRASSEAPKKETVCSWINQLEELGIRMMDRGLIAR